jgi:hypothetical protein
MKEQEQKIMTLEEALHQARRPASGSALGAAAGGGGARFGLR